LGGGSGGPGDASVIYRSGTITLDGSSFSDGIFATAPGSSTITTASGTTITVNQAFSSDTGQKGIEAFATSGATTVTAASSILVNGNPTSPVADFRSQPSGIQLQSNVGPATVDYTGPGITVHGGGGLGIVAVSGSNGNTSASGSGPVTVNASGSGPIVADGSDAVGILADSGTLRDTVRNLTPTLTTGLVRVTASNVSTPGQFGTAISANGGSGGVTVTTNGSIMGGWQATPYVPPASPLLAGRPPTSATPPGNISSISGLPAAGVFLSANGGGTAALINNGSIGALSDLAIAGDPQVTNNTGGTITGFTQFTGDDNSILNNGTFNLRHFADTNGDGVRDTNRVAVADLGTGGSFTNNGTLALAALPTSPTPIIDSTGEYLPLGNPHNTMALGGPLQGQIIGVSTFTNSGTIDLQANPSWRRVDDHWRARRVDAGNRRRRDLHLRWLPYARHRAE
jgi:hypothetical protein